MQAILAAALKGSDPARGVAAAATELMPAVKPKLVVLACGKAASSMVAAAVSACGASIIHGGMGVTKYGHTEGHGSSRGPVPMLEAGHPNMDLAGRDAASQIVQYVRSEAKDAIVLTLISGGGSALTPLPADGLSFDDFASTNSALLACGASIDEVNAVRKHLSAFSGGRLAVEIEKAGALSSITLAVSDVIGDRADVIASGPTVPDTSSYQDAWDVVQRYGIADKLPKAVLAHLQAGCEGRIPETPKQPVSIPSVYRVVAGNRAALEAAADAARAVGYHPIILTSCMQGEARHAASMFAAMVHECLTASKAGARAGWSFAALGSGHGSQGTKQPIALIAGGETTVTLGPVHGKGGRNQEFALASAVALSKLVSPADLAQAHLTVASIGTDGTDGPTDAAGALATQHTVLAAKAAGLDPHEYLDRHDAYTFFSRLEEHGQAQHGGGAVDQVGVPQVKSPQSGGTHDTGGTSLSSVRLPSGQSGGLLRTGPTGTNVMDVVVALVGRPGSLDSTGAGS